MKPTAFHIEKRGTDHALMLLNVALHGAATMPWALNDRIRSDWLHPTATTVTAMHELVDAQFHCDRAKAAVDRAKGAQRALAASATAAEKDAAVEALKAAEDEHARAERTAEQRRQALGGRMPLPTVRTVKEGNSFCAALSGAPVSSGVAAATQKYAVERLRYRGRQRNYDLKESLVLEGQREATVVVLQLTPMADYERDEKPVEAWRLYHVTGNNRADCRQQIFGVAADQLLTGVPHVLLKLDDEVENKRLILRGLAEILRRLSSLLNTEYADPDRDMEGRAERAKRIAEVPTRVVVGAIQPERLETALRDLNVHDHLRGQLVYDDEDRGLGIWSTIVNAYQAKGLLTELLAKEITKGRIVASDLDHAAVADALVGAGPLEPLGKLLVPGEEASPRALRDMAIRCATVLLFPPVPPRPAGLSPRSPMPTGSYWTTVRQALQEAPWSQQNGAKARRRSEVWAAVVAQHFVHRGNLLAMDSAFTALEVQFGARSDKRSLSALTEACRKGDAEAWETLVRRHLLPGLVNAPEPLITSGQGSEKGEDRKGVRRTPANATLALIDAFTNPPDGVTRDLLLALAENVLGAPDTSPTDGLAQGTFWAPDENGSPRIDVLADKAWFDTTFPKVSGSGPKRKTKSSGGDDVDTEDFEGRHGETSTEIDEEIDEPPAIRMTRLRGELPNQVARAQVALQNAQHEATALLEAIKAAVAARKDAGLPEEPAEVQKGYVADCKEAQQQAGSLGPALSEAIIAVMEL
ncbi:hypothetical protein [Amycolatopsis sp. WAC 04197]|uniref:hypothetical protein n=1 Tax=Amycolatopsis sp. WAC 04197 TaxID=2203199 RepID=UPI0018F56535|nr:hypothetical protein [Amycolatopsis sp. WAC 04197]